MLDLYGKIWVVQTKAQLLHSESEQVQPLPYVPQLQHQICTLMLS